MALIIDERPLVPEIFFDYDAGGDYKVLLPCGARLTGFEAAQHAVGAIRWYGVHALRLTGDRILEQHPLDADDPEAST